MKGITFKPKAKIVKHKLINNASLKEAPRTFEFVGQTTKHILSMAMTDKCQMLQYEISCIKYQEIVSKVDSIVRE